MEKKGDIRVMIKETGILLAITLITGVMLGFVYELTKEPIRLQEEKAIREACEAAFPASSANGLAFRPTEYLPDETLAAELAAQGVTVGEVYTVTDGETTCGFVVEATSGNGYGGDIVLYVGVSCDGTVKGVSILELSETAGLGMKAPEVLTPQFADRNVESFVYVKGGAAADNEVDAITGATVTTAAVVDAVNGAVRTARYLNDNWPQAAAVMGGDGDE